MPFRVVGASVRRSARPWIALLAGLVVGASSFAYAFLAVDRTVPEQEPPTVAFTSVEVSGMFVPVEVAEAQPARGLARFRATLDTPIGPRELNPLSDRVTDRLQFFDSDRDGRLSVDDRFQVESSARGTYTLSLYWRDAFVANASWRVPIVNWSARGWGPSEYEIEVDGSDPPEPLSDYVASVWWNSSMQTELRPLRDSTTPDGLLSFYDRDGNALLTPGDLFVVRPTGPGTWSLRLEWRTIYNWGYTWT